MSKNLANFTNDINLKSKLPDKILFNSLFDIPTSKQKYFKS